MTDHPAAAALHAAHAIAQAIRAAIRARGTCTLALSGGRSPVALFEALATENIAWQSVHIFQVDERMTGERDEDRNWNTIRAALVDRIEIPAANLHPVPIDTGDPERSAAVYAKQLQSIAGLPPILDIVHLGLGEDGHTASLIPGDPVLERVETAVSTTGPYQGHRRVTLTLSCLQRARRLIWFVTGAAKAAALRRLEDGDEGIPAGRLHHDCSTAWVDRDAGGAGADGRAMCVLAIDVGGSHVKFMDSVNRERRKFDSDETMTPAQMCQGVRARTKDWNYDAVAIGIPAPVRDGRPRGEPPNLGAGWTDFDYAGAFDKPVRIMNDAALQALGSYRGGRMLFLGLGTGLGSAFIADGTVLPLELAHLPYRKQRSYEDYVGERGLDRLGKDKWRRHVRKVVRKLAAAMLPDETVLGGGNVRLLDEMPDGCRRGDNENAFLGGFRLWHEARLHVHTDAAKSAEGTE